MSISRIMGAGLAGSTRKGDGANVNQVQFGNKLQGLPPTTGQDSNSLRAINNRAFGNQRNVVFCVNQLGGVGGIRGSNMFASTADGVGNCVPGPYEPNPGPGPVPEPGLGDTYESEPESDPEPEPKPETEADVSWQWYKDPYCDPSGSNGAIHESLDISGGEITFTQKGARAVSAPMKIADTKKTTCILLKYKFNDINEWNNFNFYATIRSDLEDVSNNYLGGDSKEFLYFPNGYYDGQATYSEKDDNGNKQTQVSDDYIEANDSFGQFAVGTKDYTAMVNIDTNLNDKDDGFIDASYNDAWNAHYNEVSDEMGDNNGNEYQFLPPLQPFPYNPALRDGNKVELNYVCPEIDFVETCGKVCAATAVHIEVSRLLEPDTSFTDASGIWGNVLKDGAINTLFEDLSLNFLYAAENPAFYNDDIMDYNNDDQDPKKVIMGQGVDRSCKLISGSTKRGQGYLHEKQIGWYDGNQNSYYDGILYQKGDANCYQKLNTEADIVKDPSNAINIEQNIMKQEPVYQLITFSEDGLKISWIADEGIAKDMYSECCENNTLISNENNVLEPSSEDANDDKLVPFIGAWQSGPEGAEWPLPGSSATCEDMPFVYYNTSWAGGFVYNDSSGCDCSLPAPIGGAFWQKYQNMNDTANEKNIYELTGERLHEANKDNNEYIVFYSSIWNVISDGSKQADKDGDKYGDWYAGMFNGLKCVTIMEDFVKYNNDKARKKVIDELDKINVNVSLEVVSYCNLTPAI